MNGLPGEFQRWLWQVGVLQRAFPNSTLRLDGVVEAADEVEVHRLLSCRELKNVTIYPTSAAGMPDRQLWQAIATLGRLHDGRLQLLLPADALHMLEAEPSLAAHISQAALAWGADAGSGWADQVSGLSSLTKLTLCDQDSALGEAGMLNALRHLSALHFLQCQGDVLQTLLVESVPRSWPLLTQLQLSAFRSPHNAWNWSLVEQQCPQLQALAMDIPIRLCLTALTSLTCRRWLLQEGFQGSHLAHLHVRSVANLKQLPSTLTSLTLDWNPLELEPTRTGTHLPD